MGSITCTRKTIHHDFERQTWQKTPICLGFLLDLKFIIIQNVWHGQISNQRKPLVRVNATNDSI